MLDVTDAVWTFREAARHLWNTAFVPPDHEAAPPGARAGFDRVAATLFEALVLAPHGVAGVRIAAESDALPAAIERLRVVPRADGIPIHVNRTDPPGDDWDEALGNVPTVDAATLQFVRFFDFDLLGRRELQYVQVRIAAFTAADHVFGRHALVHAGHVRFGLADAT